MTPRTRFALVAANASLVVLFFFTIAACPASAQVQTGTSKYESFGGGPFDSVNLGNLNVHFTMPILHKPGRGLPFNFDLNYDSTFWQPVLISGQYYWNPGPPNGGNPTDGWSGSAIGVGTLLYSYSLSNTTCYYNGDPSHQAGNYPCWIYYAFDYVDGLGTTHPFSGSAEWFYTINVDLPLQATSSDGSGYALTWDAQNSNFSLYTADGNAVVPSNSLLGPGSPASVVDRNGNYISESSNGNFTDTLGTQVLTTSGGSPNPYVMTYTDPNGHPASTTLTWAPYTVQTNFGCTSPTIIDFPATSAYLKDRLTLPNGTYYQFNYEPTAGYPGKVTGRLASVTLPTGGTTYYTYTGGANGYNAIHCFEGSPLGLTRQTPDGTWTYARTFGVPYLSTTTITDPVGNQSVIQFVTGPALGLTYEQQRQVYQGSASSGTLMETVTTCYDGNTTNCAGASVGFPLTQRAITTQLGSVLSEHVYSYDSYGNPTETDDYDWGTGAVGPLLRKTLSNYPALGNTIKSFAQTTTIQNASGTQVAMTTYNYDGSALQATSGVPQHSNAPGTARGNLTSVQQWVNTTGTQLTTRTTTYFDTGMVYIAKDANSDPTTYTYSSTFGSAYATQITNALSQNTDYNYDTNTGVLKSSQDPNDIANSRTGTTYTYDNILRLTQTNYPDGGQTAVCYTDTGGTCTKSGPPFNLVTTKKMTSSLNLMTTAVTDSQGRTTQNQVNSDPEGVTKVDTAYDSLGRTYTVSNPHRSSSSPTDGTTTYKYDALSRTTEIDQPDGSKLTTAYSGNCTTVTDEAAKARKSCADGLGRTTGAWEDPNGLNYQTSYTYDALDNLLSVAESGSRQRAFTYDSLSRLQTVANPESGTVCYGTYSGSTCQHNGYDANGNALYRTDARGVATTNTYDSLNRILSKTYSDGVTPGISYTYDVSSQNGATILNPIGRLVIAQVTNCIYTMNSYDPMGRVAGRWQVTPYNCSGGLSNAWYMSYNYNLLGEVSSRINAAGITFTQTYDTAARATQITSSLVDSTHLGTLASGITYWPSGAIENMAYGSGLTEATYYNNRLQPCRINVNSSSTSLSACTGSAPSGNLQDFQYGLNWGSSDNGNVASWNGSGKQIFNRSYTYDNLNRVAGLTDTVSGNPCPGLSWSYDAWGNRTAQTVTSGSCTASSLGYNSSNRITNTNFTYDAAGNMTDDGGNHVYYYDAENRVVQVGGTLGTCTTSTACYLYNAEGRRVRKSSAGQILDYLYGADGSVADEFAIQTGYTGWATYYVYLNGQTLTQYKNNTLYFLHQDHLGSTRLMTSITGAIYDWMDFLPFGEQLAGDTGTRHKFTGQDRDSESAPTLQPLDGLDSFGARYYTSLNGRFMTPDPAGASATCLLNPQTQNRYAYVTNNPVNRTDPTGLCGDGDNSDCGPTIGISIPFGPGGGGGGNPAPPTPHPVFVALSPLSDLTGSGSWEDCRQNVFIPCINAALTKHTDCNLLAGGMCVARLALCSGVCRVAPGTICQGCLNAAIASCATGKVKCENDLSNDTRTCYDKQIACASKGPQSQ